MEKNEEVRSSITEHYEQEVLNAFRTWYQRTQPTIKEASDQAYLIARDTVKGLSATKVQVLLQEHPGWIYQQPPEWHASDQMGIEIGELTRRHIVKFLEHKVQQYGFQVVQQQQVQER